MHEIALHSAYNSLYSDAYYCLYSDAFEMSANTSCTHSAAVPPSNTWLLVHCLVVLSR